MLDPLLCNMQMLLDELEEDYSLTIHWKTNLQQLKNAKLFGESPLQLSYVYIGAAEELRSAPHLGRDYNLLSVGFLSDDEIEALGCTVLCILNTCDLKQIFNKVVSIFDKYHDWDNQIRSVICHGGNVSELCRISMDFFENPLFVHDEKFNIISMPQWVFGMLTPTSNKYTGRKMIPLEIINEFNASPEYAQTFGTHGAQFWSTVHGGMRTLYVNMYDQEGLYIGRLLINETKTSLKPGQMRLAEYFAEIIKLCLCKRNVFSPSDTTEIETFFQAVSTGTLTDKEQIRKYLSYLEWKFTHAYCCLKINTDFNNGITSSINSIRNEIERKIPETYTFYYEQRIWVLINLSISQLTMENIRERLIYTVRESMLKIGCSDMFDNFLMVPHYFSQAEIVLHYFQQNHNTLQFSYFSEYAVDYILEYGTRNLPREVLCAKSLILLRNYDLKNSTQLFHTLEIYLSHDRNLVESSALLFIHRTTLSYRLNRIEQVTGIHLNDYKTRLYLQISFHLMQNQTASYQPDPVYVPPKND